MQQKRCRIIYNDTTMPSENCFGAKTEHENEQTNEKYICQTNSGEGDECCAFKLVKKCASLNFRELS